ncbi:MAG: SAM-dependent DNA methyltransferase [Chloroflexi bacterium]|nr:SAM-dependent DNA methyltransferase [Chloroflexota bacterium]
MKDKTKVSSKAKIPSPFEAVGHKTEWTATAILMHWMRGIIQKRSLALGMPDVETIGADKKKPDLVIYESPSSDKVLCLIEAKPPYYDVFSEEELKEPAREKASKRKAKYFALTNFKRLVWFSTEKVNSMLPEEEQIVDKYNLSAIEDLNDIEQTKYSDPIKKGLEDFLLDLHAIHAGKKAEPKHAIDEFLVYRLQEKISVLSGYYRKLIEGKTHSDPAFARKLSRWFVDQGWSFAWQASDFGKAARQTAYLLTNKILFYNLLQAKRPRELDPLEVPEGLTKAEVLQKTLEGYFGQILKIDYETIYTTDFIDAVAFPDSIDVVKEIRELVRVLRKYDFSKLGYDVIGRIFERLIPADERHNLGQYFTSPDVVDLILKFCVQHEDDKVLDPACGAGTFLVRAYQHKRLMNQKKSHEAILETLWGNDIAKFPAHLATINLAINDLGVDKNYPNVLQEDFFALLVGEGGFDPEKWRKVRARTLGLKERELTCPRWFDAIVGNPPYTRQEEIAEISPEDVEYKEKLIEKALLDLKGKKIAEIGRRAGIHVYFFVHGIKFLKEGGYFGFIVSDPWLDVDYGKGLQEFFLNNYKIIAVIGSKVERWFEEADTNTCIVILHRCKDKKQRYENRVRFVYLKKPLRHFIPPAQDMWEKQVKRLEAIGDLKKTILFHNDLYENDDLRIFPRTQKELWQEGFDPEEKKYVGAKWGKYLRAPAIFFTILDKGKGKLVPLRQVAKVHRGFTSGADPWFYVEDIGESLGAGGVKQIAAKIGYHGDTKSLRPVKSGDDTKWLLEGQYLHPVIRNPDEYGCIVIDVKLVKDRVVFIGDADVKGKFVEKYVLHGQTKAYQMGKGRKSIPSETGTCSSRPHWYQLPDVKPSRLLWQKAFDISHRHYLASEPVLANQRFYPIYPNSDDDTEVTAAFLNSALVALNLEFQRAAMGLGAIEATVEEVRQILVVNPKVVAASTRDKLSKELAKLGKREVGSVFEEFGAPSPEDVSLDKVKPDRRELDRIIMGEVLGLTDEEQMEVYRAVVDLVKSRVDKAQTFGKKMRSPEGIDVDALKKVVLDSLREEEE